MPQAFGRAPGLARRARRHRGAGGLRRRDHLPRAVGGLHAADPQPGPAAVEPGPARAAGPATPRPSRRRRRRHRPDAATEAVQILRTYPAILPKGYDFAPAGGAQRGARQHQGRRARPAAGLPRGPVPVVGGGRPALRQGPAREPRAAAHRGDPDGPRRGRRAHPARRSSTGASWRWTCCSRPGATGSPCTGSPARRATRSTCTPRSASSTTCGPASGPTTSTGARGRATRRSPARCRTCGCPTATPPAPRDSFALRVRRELVAEHLGIEPDDVPDDPDEVWDLHGGRGRRRSTTWYAGGAAPARPAPPAATQGAAQGHRRCAGGAAPGRGPGRPGVERPPGRLRRLSPPELTRAQLLWAPRLYDLFDPDGTVLRDDRI